MVWQAFFLLLVLTSCRIASGEVGKVTAVRLPAEEVPARLGELEVLDAFDLRSADRRFGGISAARFDGDRLLLLSDRSRLFEIEWPGEATGDGWAATVLDRRYLTHGAGDALDSEALVVGSDHRLLVADESGNEIFAYAPGHDGPGTAFWQPPQPLRAGAAANQGVEALTVLPDGDLLAIGEGSSGQPGIHPAAIRSMSGEVRAGTYTGDGRLDPSDAATAGDWLLVLERSVSLLTGWRVRIVAVPMAEIVGDPLQVPRGRVLATISGAVGENYEALAVRPEEDGSFELVLVSDDNFSPLQRTLLLELRWRP
jgi:hypothetical protein